MRRSRGRSSRVGEIGDVLRQELGDDAPERIMALIRGKSDSPLQGLISGSLDLDKIEYLKRDAFMCGVNYGDIDVDRLLINSLTLVDDPERGSPMVGISEKGLSALESLLFAKYQMYRNVYWHHAVRSATAMYKRLVDGALRAGSLGAEALAGFTDEGLLHELAPARPRRCSRRCASAGCTSACSSARPPSCRPTSASGSRTIRALVVAVEDQLARELHLQPGELLLDYPVKTQMLGLDIPVRRRDGSVRRLTAAGWEGAVNLPKLSEELYGSARWLRVFTAQRVPVARSAVIRLASLSTLTRCGRWLRRGNACSGVVSGASCLPVVLSSCSLSPSSSLIPSSLRPSSCCFLPARPCASASFRAIAR